MTFLMWSAFEAACVAYSAISCVIYSTWLHCELTTNKAPHSTFSRRCCYCICVFVFSRGSRLHIRRSRTSDSGLYQCRADNLAGHSDLANATVFVEPPGKCAQVTSSKVAFWTSTRCGRLLKYCVPHNRWWIKLIISELFMACGRCLVNQPHFGWA